MATHSPKLGKEAQSSLLRLLRTRHTVILILCVASLEKKWENVGWLEIQSGDSGNVGVIVEGANQVRDGRQAQVVVSDEAVPRYLSLIRWSAGSPFWGESTKKFFIGQCLENCFKLSNDGRYLSIRTEYSTMGVAMGKL